MDGSRLVRLLRALLDPNSSRRRKKEEKIRKVLAELHARQGTPAKGLGL